MSLEGELRLVLRLQAGRIAAVEIGSTRPDVASQLLQGRRVDEVQAAVPRLFSVCARSQAAACRLACAAAAGATVDATALAQARAEVAEETVRETAWQVLLQQPRWLDETPTPEATAAARAAQAWRWRDAGADEDHAASDTIARAVFGCSAPAWLERVSWPEVRAWAAAGQTAAARYLHTVASVPADIDAGTTPPLLPAPGSVWLTAVADAAAADAAYTRAPLWRGLPAETGAWARQQADALIVAATRAGAPRPELRHLSRLLELARLLAGRWQPGLGALALAPGRGVGWADNARGLLVHHVQLDGERVRLYRIVAPTEWNFHPRGALASELTGAPVANTAAARQRAQRLVNSLDPCVSCTIEIADA